jgi:hypothetical protein
MSTVNVGSAFISSDFRPADFPDFQISEAWLPWLLLLLAMLLVMFLSDTTDSMLSGFVRTTWKCSVQLHTYCFLFVTSCTALILTIPCLVHAMLERVCVIPYSSLIFFCVATTSCVHLVVLIHFNDMSASVFQFSFYLFIST